MIKIPINTFPGVYVSINDNSNVYAEAVPGAIGFMCILSEKGPDNRPVMVTSVTDLITRYGKPSIRKYGQAWYVAKEYLTTLNNLWVMRVLPSNATYATLALKLNHEDTTVPYNISKDADGKTVLTEISTNDGDVVLTVPDLNSETTTLTEILESVPTGKSVEFPATTINRTASYDQDIILMGARNGVAATEAPRVGNETVFNGPIEGSTTLKLDGFTLGEYALTNDYSDVEEVDVKNCRILGLAGANNTVPEEYSENIAVEEEQDLNVNYVTTRDYKFVDVELKDIKSVPEMASYLSGENSQADIIFYPYGRGEYYNRLGIKLTKAKKSYPNAFIIDVYEASEDSSSNMLLESFTVSFDIDAKDISGSSLFIKDVLDMYSDYIKCEVSNNIGMYEEDSEETTESGDVNTLNVKYDNLATTTIRSFSGGKDGSMYDKNGNLNWEVEAPVMNTDGEETGDFENMTMALSNAYMGLVINPETGEYNEEITDTENMDFTVVFDAGWPSPVKKAIETLCDSRESCFGFLDNGVASENGNRGADVALKVRRGEDPNHSHTFNNYRLALYEPYTKLYDSFTGTYFWATPIIHAVSCFARTARNYNIWWAFAGLNRGACSGIKDYRYKLAGGYKDMFKESELNPIMRFNQGGDVIWGNWTTKQTPSALKNIHVVLCLQYIHRTLERNLKQFVYEFNDAMTYSRINETVSGFLGTLQSQRALESYSVSVGATEYQKRNNQCTVSVDLKVTGVIEIINVSLNVN